MAKQTIDFAKLIQEDREQRQQQQWQGTFLEYLELVKKDPDGQPAHRRHHDMIIEARVSELNPENDPWQRIYGDERSVYNFFKEEFFDGAHARQDRALFPFGGDGARGMPPGSTLVGPVGSGKSSWSIA